MNNGVLQVVALYGGPTPTLQGGKSELGRVRWWLMTTRGDPRESATENIPPSYFFTEMTR